MTDSICSRIFVSALILLACGTAPAQVRIDDYLRQDGYRSIKISPDGRHLAATKQMEDRVGLVIIRRADKKVVGGATSGEGSAIDDFWWGNDDRVVIAMAEQFGSRDEPYATGELFTAGIDGKQARKIAGAQESVQIADEIGSSGGWQMATMVDPLPNDPRHVLISTWTLGSNPWTEVNRLDIYNGRRTRVASAPVNRARFLTDATGTVRFALGARDDNYSKLYYRDDDKTDWRLVNDEASSGHIERAIGFSRDGRIAYLLVTQDRGPDMIDAWDTRSGERKRVPGDTTVDPYALLFEADGATLIGMQYMRDGVHTVFVDGDSPQARTHRALAEAFPDAAVNVTSYTRDGVALVQAWNDRTPGDTYLFDPKTMSADGVYVQREWFDPAKLPKSRWVEIKARDGTLLHGYLTPPRNAPAGQSVPMVVMPHGGPFGVFDQWAFDDDTQLLAEAGYAVLRVNFRGSGNYGIVFERAGAREWGGSMQDDLTDATRWAIAQRIAVADKICIYGASYGGYAALMGVAKEPGLYRCAAGYVGVYDLEAMHRKDSRSARWLGNWLNDWVGARGDLAATSPVNLAERIKVPVFLAAGGADQIAPITHSKRMANALRDAGNPPETLFIDSEGHGFYTQAHRREYYTKLLDFLARNLGGARAAD